MTGIAVWLLLAVSWAGPRAEAQEHASKSVDAFNQYLSQLQQKPDDQALRKKIIRLGQRLKPAPEITKEARSHFSKAYSLQRDAKGPGDYEAAVDEYQKALAIAPWWAAVYYHLGTAYERMGKNDSAIENLRLYLASNPGHAGEREALDRIRRLEATKKNTGKKPDADAARTKS